MVLGLPITTNLITITHSSMLEPIALRMVCIILRHKPVLVDGKEQFISIASKK
jgi:hypothetical protein